MLQRKPSSRSSHSLLVWMAQPPWKTVWQFLTKLSILFLYDPAIVPLGIYSKELKNFVVVQSLSGAQLFVTPWTAARQTPLSFTTSRHLLKFMSIESVKLMSTQKPAQLTFITVLFIIDKAWKQPSVGEWIKKTVVYPVNGMLFSTEWASKSWKVIEKPSMHTIKWTKSIWKGFTLYDSSYVIFWKRQNYGDGKRISGCQGFWKRKVD